MTTKTGIAAILAAMVAVVMPAAGSAAPARRATAAAAVDWTSHIAVTPSGSYVRGNPQAKVKLVEYASFTCSHCAAFQAEAMPAIDGMIRSGRLSLEVRNAIRDRFDLAAALLARCQGPAGYFRAAAAIFAQQPQWLAKAATLPEPAVTTSMNDTLATVARGAGIDRVAAPGLSATKVNACIANAAEQGRLARMRDEAWNERRISGTPYFVVNGQGQADVYDWAALQPVLQAALAK